METNNRRPSLLDELDEDLELDELAIQEPHDPEIDEIVKSKRAGGPVSALPLNSMLREMCATYRDDSVKSVRNSKFINYLHR